MKSNNKIKIVIFRSNRFITGSFVSTDGKTILSLSSKKISDSKKPTERANLLGQKLAEMATSKKLTDFVFDRNGFRYQGQVKALAEGLRSGGINI